MGELQKLYVKLKKEDTNDYILYYTTYMKYSHFPEMLKFEKVCILESMKYSNYRFGNDV